MSSQSVALGPPTGRAIRDLAGCGGTLCFLALLAALPLPAAQNTWGCGGEGEVPCGANTDFFWQNGNLFADRGLIATGFRVLPDIKFNANDWMDFNRVDFDAAVQLVQVEWPALKARIENMDEDDFLDQVCIGVEEDGRCWTLPPSAAQRGTYVLGVCTGVERFGECWAIPPVESFEFEWTPDFSKPGWHVFEDIEDLLERTVEVLGKFPASIKGIPGSPSNFHYDRADWEDAFDIDSFEDFLDDAKSFFSNNNVFYRTCRDFIADFTDPPSTARCVNDTRRQSVPANFTNAWAHWALLNQRELAKYEPLSWYSHLGTHNAFNTAADGYIAPNQRYSLTDQLNLGSRWLSLDVHWFNGKLRLSHAGTSHEGAGAADRFFANGIKEIRNWLDQNSNEVIVLALEDRSDGHHAELVDPLEEYLGARLHRRIPKNFPRSRDHQSYVYFNGLSSYAGQDGNPDGGAFISAERNRLQLVFNTWKKMPFRYHVTSNSVLQFKFSNTIEGEYHGIGFAHSNEASAVAFHLNGPQNGALSFKELARYDGGVQSYLIPVGQYYQGPVEYMTFINDDDRLFAIGMSSFQDVRVFEANAVVNFSNVVLQSYGPQDVQVTVTITNNGRALKLKGNGWKKIDMPYEVTARTVLEFDFDSSVEGEVHGIGFDIDDSTHDVATTHAFVLWGTQTNGYPPAINTYRNYGHLGRQHFRIPVGQHFTGANSYLTFIHDHDVSGANAESTFSNIVLYEDADPTIDADAERWPTVQELRDAGKQVIVIGDEHYSTAVWPDVFGYGYGPQRSKNFVGDFANLTATSDSSAIAPVASARISTQYEARTGLDVFDPSGLLTADGVRERFLYNVTEVSLDMLRAQEDTAPGHCAGPEVCGSPDERIAAAVWSWKPGQPEDVLPGSTDNGENAALMDGTGRWESRSPTEVHFFACAKPRGCDPTNLVDRFGADWRVTERAYQWADAPLAVAELNAQVRRNGADDDGDGQIDEFDEGTYVFAVPMNAWQNEILRRRLEELRIRRGLANASAWLAYHDRIKAGKWTISRSFPIDATSGTALQFDGVDDRVVIPGFGRVISTNEVTIEFWQKVDQTKYQSTFRLEPDQGTNRINVHVPYGNGRVYWQFGNISSGGELSYLPPVPITGTWQHFAFVVSQRGNYMRIFRNGILEAEKTGMRTFVRGDYDLSIGGGPGRQFGGQLDELRVWNVARTPSEIQNAIHARLNGNEMGLVGYWPFDEAAGTSAMDLTGKSSAGTLINGTGRIALGEPAVWPILGAPQPGAAGGMVWSFSGEANRAYRVEYSEDLVQWQVLTNISAGPPSVHRISDEALGGVAHRFFRVLIP